MRSWPLWWKRRRRRRSSSRKTLGCSCKSQPLVISNDISHVGKRMPGLIRAPLLFSTAAKVLPHTSKATAKVMSGADAASQEGVGDALPAHVRRGPCSLLPPQWSAAHLAVNESIIFFWDKSQPTPRYGLPTVTMMNPFISCNKPAGEVIYPRFAGELYTGSGGGRRHGDEARRVAETLSHTGGREDAVKSRKNLRQYPTTPSQSPAWIRPGYCPPSSGSAAESTAGRRSLASLTFGWQHELSLFFFSPPLSEAFISSASSITEWRPS